MTGGSSNHRIFAAYAGAQGSGKTYQLCRRIERLRANPRISSVFVLDRLGEFGQPIARPVSSRAEYARLLYMTSNVLPRAISFQLGLDASAYDWVLTEAVAIGGVALVVDEAWEFLPQERPIRDIWRPIIFAGRHLRTEDGRICPTHVILATQYPRTVHPQVWGQVSECWCSRLVGDRALSWVRDYYGSDQADAVRDLRGRDWRLVFTAR